MRIACAFVTCALCLLPALSLVEGPFALTGSAAQVPQQPPPRFTAGVDIVEMPVTVLDKDHKPVRGLTAKDFTVLEDGKPQKIVAFSEFVPAPPVVQPARWMREVPRDVETNAVVDKNLFVIVIDDATLSPATPPPGGGVGGGRISGPLRAADSGASMDVYRLDTLRKVAHRAIELLGDGDLAAVVFANDNFSRQTFTSDRSKLIRSVDSVTFGPAHYKSDLMPVQTDCQPLWFTTGALRASVEALASAPHGRKTVLVRHDRPRHADPGKAPADVPELRVKGAGRCARNLPHGPTVECQRLQRRSERPAGGAHGRRSPAARIPHGGRGEYRRPRGDRHQ